MPQADDQWVLTLGFREVSFQFLLSHSAICCRKSRYQVQLSYSDKSVEIVYGFATIALRPYLYEFRCTRSPLSAKVERIRTRHQSTEG